MHTLLAIILIRPSIFYEQDSCINSLHDYFTACVVNSNEVCFPRKNCHGNVLPQFIINDNLFFPGADDNIIIGEDNICFKNITETFHYIERCHESFTCANLSSYNEELVILQRIRTKTTAGSYKMSKSHNNHYIIAIIVIKITLINCRSLPTLQQSFVKSHMVKLFISTRR